ncbi:excinuclease ABC subunit C [Halioglobus japonicus]|uniref:UvrABC system protein C n=1 Tax=Halioglobus japonicus TaxID=930805 RepID=A0AAP8SNS7_9GAMM|nr:excinuclease ABC subunit UvrC [Halioglobus japonicus]AQA18772.1 excinuclease ABC subunit C [Halioglobus japonicus]PLW86804.1 excinuclease ABC subunit UvrC [Halioglobus japonicus]GHD10983.1 UvrABC system protein C [Halioglobus japonicus]
MSSFDHKAFLKTLTTRPGVYQMYDEAAKLLYVGKAKNLRNRVGSYFRASGLTDKTVALVNRIAEIQVTVTSTEVDALLLEHNLIKTHQPPYNILLKDDKSYPYIYMSGDTFPRISLHRGAQRKKGRYFGPYPSAGAVRESLHFMQKVFKVRQCEDSYFRNRSRPCLQYQIDRCTAPCVDLVSEADYAEQVENTSLFLKGKSQQLMVRLADDMEKAAAELEYEKAAVFRDQLAQLQQVQASQGIEGVQGDLDIMAAAVSAGRACVQVLFVRGARVLGSKTYYPPLKLEETPAMVLEAFLPQYYLNGSRAIPGEVIVNALPDDAETLAEALSVQAERKVKLRSRVRDARARWLRLAVQTAETNLQSHLADRQTVLSRLENLQDILQLPELPERMECFDISHSSGEATVASCVVFDQNGPRKSDYRKFNIEGITGGDDYAAMQQALERRFKRLKSGEGAQPDILFIDGGKGQVTQAMEVLQELQISGVEVIGVAKGVTRKAGFETLIDGSTGREWQLPGDSPALHLIQQVRDEAHRFAITGHRARRDKSRQRSVLEDIPGVGAKRRRELLRHFGSAQGVVNANVEELQKISGISATMAQQIYDHLHGNTGH